MNDTSDDRARLARIKTDLMNGVLPTPHDLAWLFRLADEAVMERQKKQHHTEG